jgi:hypothetical protein
MPLIERKAIIAQLKVSIDPVLSTQLVDEFISIEKRYIQRDWEPAELDGGQFAEILSRILYSLDSQNQNFSTKSVHDCLEYVEDQQNKNKHNFRSKDVLHIAKALRLLYKFRSDRGAVHISPTYTANQMDAKLMLELVRWCFSDTLRIMLSLQKEQVAKIIRELIQFDVPVIGVFDDIIVVQRTHITAEEEILILLHYSGDAGFDRTELGKHCKFQPSTITNAIKKLVASDCLQIVKLSNGRYRLTDLGSKRIREELSEKLLAD